MTRLGQKLRQWRSCLVVSEKYVTPILLLETAAASFHSERCHDAPSPKFSLVMYLREGVCGHTSPLLVL